MTGNVGRAWWGTVVLFLVHGLVVGSWVSRIPAVQNRLHINNGVLGLTLLSSAVGAVVAIPITGWLVNRYGSKIIGIITSFAFCAAVVPLGAARQAWSLALMLFVFGATAAAMDVSMNAQGVEVEKELGRPTMSRFHAMFSLGAMAGAAIGGWAAAQAFSPLAHFIVSGAVNTIAVCVAGPMLINVHDYHAVSAGQARLKKTPRVLLALSAIGFCILLSEGAMADWTAVYLRQILNAGQGLAAEGYAVFAAAMAIFRGLGDMITARLGPFRTVRTGTLLATCGLFFALCMHDPVAALPGFAAMGAGLSVIIPLVFGGGGRVEGVPPGKGIAIVTGIGYVGFIAGPPAIGFASQLLTLRYALGIVVACCLIASSLAGFMRLLQTSTHAEAVPELQI